MKRVTIVLPDSTSDLVRRFQNLMQETLRLELADEQVTTMLVELGSDAMRSRVEALQTIEDHGAPRMLEATTANTRARRPSSAATARKKAQGASKSASAVSTPSRPRRKRGEKQEVRQILCGCGCGEALTTPSPAGYERKFLRGHKRKNAAFSAEHSAPKPRVVWSGRDELLPGRASRNSENDLYGE